MAKQRRQPPPPRIPESKREQALRLDQMRTTFARWLKEPDSVIAIFQNHDLGHWQIGRKIAVRHTYEQLAAAMAQAQTPAHPHVTAPDHPLIGFGWRYVLQGLAGTVEAALILMERRAE